MVVISRSSTHLITPWMRVRLKSDLMAMGLLWWRRTHSLAGRLKWIDVSWSKSIGSCKTILKRKTKRILANPSEIPPEMISLSKIRKKVKNMSRRLLVVISTRTRAVINRAWVRTRNMALKLNMNTSWKTNSLIFFSKAQQPALRVHCLLLTKNQTRFSKLRLVV